MQGQSPNEWYEVLSLLLETYGPWVVLVLALIIGGGFLWLRKKEEEREEKQFKDAVGGYVALADSLKSEVGFWRDLVKEGRVLVVETASKPVVVPDIPEPTR